MTSNRIDGRSLDAPMFAGSGDHAVGVTTRRMVNPGQVDLSLPEMPRYDRPLTVEIWYPAESAAPTPYQTVLRDGVTPIVLHGQAARDAAPLAGDFPLVILSHGYPGDRLLMVHLGESLASRGYLVAGIEHRDSTYADKGAFVSTLVNRPLDTRFVADHLGATEYAIIGYSMGGYGALVAAGAGVSEMQDLPYGQAHLPHDPVVDPRLKAIIPIGPWGGKHGVWAGAALARAKVPALILAGSADEVSGYADGMRFIFDHYGAPVHLITFDGAGHNAAAPYPAPEQAFTISPHLDFLPAEHYADPVWDSVRMNGIAQHFAHVFLAQHLRGADMSAYLNADLFGFTNRQGLRLEQR